jgi:hypothetical protein
VGEKTSFAIFVASLSLMNGMMLSYCCFLRFPHFALADEAARLQAAPNTAEVLFSSSGQPPTW